MKIIIIFAQFFLYILLISRATVRGKINDPVFQELNKPEREVRLAVVLSDEQKEGKALEAVKRAFRIRPYHRHSRF